MLVLGGGNAWAQTDYSGTYYIKSESANKQTSTGDYYLCPTERWIYYKATNDFQEANNGQPFLTTYCKTSEDEAKYKWILEKHTVDEHDYYSFRYATDYNSQKRYLSFNGKIGNAGQDRIRLHLEIKDTPGENELFEFFSYKTSPYLVIKPKLNDVVNNQEVPKYLVVNGGNKDSYQGASGKDGGPSNKYKTTAGIIGIFNDIEDPNAPFSLEEIIDRPTFTSTNSQIVISHPEGNNATIYYTTNGTNPTTTNYAGTGTAPHQIDMPKNAVTIKAIAVIDNLPSCISSIRVVPNATVTLGASSFTYNGSAQEPTVTVKDGNTTISSDEYTVEYGENTNAGDATVTIKNATGGSCIVYGSTTFTINKKDLTVTAQPKTITYGDAPTNDGVLYSGFVEGENESKLTGTLAYAYNYSQYGDVGDYTITPSGLTSNNYNITYVDGTLTVGQKDVGLSWSTTTTFPYDGSSHILTATATDLVNNDEVGVTVTGEQTNAGDHTATASALTGTKAGNYKLPDANTHAFSITKVPLTVTANNHSITYGDALSNSGVTYSGFVGGEDEGVLGGMLDYAYSYNLYDDVGDNYTITPSGLSSTNYTFAYNNGILTVNPKEVGIDWTNTELTYNRSAQAPTAAATGVVNDDDVSVTVTGGQTNAGNYVATASDLTGAKAGNYLLPEGLTHSFIILPKSIGDGNNLAEGISVILTEAGELDKVTDGGVDLVVDQDYTCSIETVGADKVVEVTGMGNYTGSAKGIYACPKFTDPDGTTGLSKAAAVYMALRDYAKPAGITPYIVRKVNPSIGTMVISEIAYIPEGVPVLLLSDTEVSGFTVSPKDEAVPEISAGTKNSNQLKVAPEEGVAVEAAQVYMFYKGEFVLTKKGTLTEGKFYLYNPNYAAVPDGQGSANGSRGSLQIVIEDWDDSEEPTGMISTTPDPSFQQEGSWYTLDGRCLSGEPTKSGIYIRKGQKVYIKKK